MQAKKSYRNLIALGVAALVIIALAIVRLAVPNIVFEGYAWALLPAVIAIGLALITKEVYSSLFAGIVIGGLMHSRFNLVTMFNTLISGTAHNDKLDKEFIALTDEFNAGNISLKEFEAGKEALQGTVGGLIPSIQSLAGILIFLAILGIIVALVNKTGAAAAFGRWAQKHVKTKVGAYLATFVLGVLIFIDDYFNCLTVGSVMSPVTDSHKISRVKLAYIIDATAAPVCMIAPISSWAAAVSSYVVDTPLADEMSPIKLFIRAIPFNFYSILTFVFIIAIAVLGFDYGKMSSFEIKAQNGDLGILGAENATKEDAPNPRGKLFDLLIPIAVLVVICVLALLYVGGLWSGSSFIEAFENTDATVALPLGALVALLFTGAYLICRRLISFEGLMASLTKGFIAMVPAMLILILATTLKDTTALLDANLFVHNTVKLLPEAAKHFMPAIIFLVACFIAFATGTSWGTFGILIPIVAGLFSTNIHDPLLFVGISACLAGAVCGDHCSPISDTTIMASAGANCNHVDHVSTQLPYAMTVAGISFVMYIIAGFLPYAWLCLPLGAVLTVGTLLVIRLIQKKKAPAAK